MAATLPAAMTRAIAFSSTECALPPDRTTRWLRLTGGRWPRGGDAPGHRDVDGPNVGRHPFLRAATVRAFLDRIVPICAWTGRSRGVGGQPGLPLRLLSALARVLGAGRGAAGRAHPAAADGRPSALFEAAKEQMS